ncbi:ArsC family transcriptional regulator [Treponema sp.]|uniref:arsenate reductase family protein n=1 Tax=Treponema sp. TaxID=166 RepID=UPI00298DF5CE|nr:ArsC family transcriptional regulator [Treponema sp.]MCQ2242062.1 ArsC family transcriptional regulator [Treponema sp.]
MAIQIFGTAKSFDVKKAERYFAERRIPVQKIDLKEKGISKGELESVIACLSKKAGSRTAAVELLADKKNKDYANFAYLDDSEKESKLLENPTLMIQPIVRNGKDAATVGYDPDTWKNWT